MSTHTLYLIFSNFTTLGELCALFLDTQRPPTTNIKNKKKKRKRKNKTKQKKGKRRNK